MLKISILGFGRAGKFHYNSLLRIPEVEVYSICDPHIKEEELPVQRAQNLEELLAQPKVDAVVVASPTKWHYEHIQACLKAGKHVFAEKPVGKSVEQIVSCFELAQQRNLHLFTGFQRRYDPNFLHLKSLIPSLGDPRIIKSCSRDNPKPELPFLKTSGNIFHDMLVHDFDMLIHLLGPQIPQSIYTSAHAYDKQIAEIDDFDTTLVTLKYDHGLMCAIDTSRTSVYGYDQRIEIFGSEGMAQAENLRQNSVHWSNAQGTHLAPLAYSFPQRYQDCYLLELQHFVVSLLAENKNHKDLFNVPVSEVLLSHILVEAAHLSVVRGQPVELSHEYPQELNTLSNSN